MGAEQWPASEVQKEPEGRHEHRENLERIRAKTAQEALGAAETRRPAETAEVDSPAQTFVNRELKAMAYARTMTRVRKQLSPVSQLFSRIVHQPAVNALSEVGAKTVGRPSGIIGGGLAAFVGTSIYYYLTKHYGYEYKFSVFLILLAGGFVVGWAAELLLHFFKFRRRP